MPEITGPQISTYVGHDGELTGTTPYSWATTLKKMKCHPTVKMARFLSIAPVLSAKWTIDIHDDLESQEEEIREVFEHQILRHRQRLVATALLGLIDWGWSPFEVVWDGFDIVKFKPLLQDITHIMIDPGSGDFAGFLQRHNVTGIESIKSEVTIPRLTALLFNQWVEAGNLYGESDMKAAEQDWLSSITTDETARRYDTKTAGAHWHIKFPVGESDYNGTLTDHGVIANDILKRLMANGSVATPIGADRQMHDMDIPGAVKDSPAWEINLIESNGNTSSSLNERSKYLDTRIVRAFLQPERSLLEGTHGTKAEAETHGSAAVILAEHRGQQLLESLNTENGVVHMVSGFHFGEEAVGKIKVVAEPLEQNRKEFLQTLYDKILSTPEGQLLELDNIDFQQLRDFVGVPSQANDDSDDLSLVDILPEENPEEISDAPELDEA